MLTRAAFASPRLVPPPILFRRRLWSSEVLGLFATGAYHYWAGTPVMADALGRCALAESAPSPHPAPSVCAISGRLSAGVRSEAAGRAW